jgi:DNA-binding NarL/FixJ family response regulator
MNAAAQKLMERPLRIAVLAKGPERHALLSQLVRDLGHAVVAESEGPNVVLADGIVAGASNLPAVALGLDGEGYQGRLASDATPEQIDAALRAVAVGLSVTVADEFGRGFEEIYEADERRLLTPREVEVLRAVSNGSTNKEIANLVFLNIRSNSISNRSCAT